MPRSSGQLVTLLMLDSVSIAWNTGDRHRRIRYGATRAAAAPPETGWVWHPFYAVNLDSYHGEANRLPVKLHPKYIHLLKGYIQRNEAKLAKHVPGTPLYEKYSTRIEGLARCLLAAEERLGRFKGRPPKSPTTTCSASTCFRALPTPCCASWSICSTSRCR